jgi:hypothetical protein
MRRAIPPLPQYVMAWCLVKHRDNFTFTFILAVADHCGRPRFMNLTLVKMNSLTRGEKRRHTEITPHNERDALSLLDLLTVTASL